MLVVDRPLHWLWVGEVGGRLTPLVSRDTVVVGQHWGHEWDSLWRPGKREGELCSDQDLMGHWMMVQLQVQDSEDEGPNRNRKVFRTIRIHSSTCF